jgi:hypothetical protein
MGAGRGDSQAEIVVAPRGRPVTVLELTIDGDRIAAIDVVTDPRRLGGLRLAAIEGENERLSTEMAG